MGYEQQEARTFLELAEMPMVFEQILNSGATPQHAEEVLRERLAPNINLEVVRVQNSTAFITLDNNTGQMTVAFDASDEFRDMVDDMRFWKHDHAIGGEVHSGYWHSVMRENEEGVFLDQVRDTVIHMSESTDGPISLNLTGFSRGGSMAHVATAQWLAEGFPQREVLNADITLENVYSFGGPPVGDRDFMQSYERTAAANDVNLVNVNVTGDAVPTILGEGMDWLPFAPTYYQPGEGVELQPPAGTEKVHNPDVYREAISTRDSGVEILPLEYNNQPVPALN